MIDELDALGKTHKKLIVGGDLNVNYNVETPEKRQLEEWSTKNDLIQTVEENTWHRVCVSKPSSVPVSRHRNGWSFCLIASQHIIRQAKVLSCQ